MNVTNPYEVLGVSENASLDDCTAAYKKLVKKYHPDLNPNDVIASEAMKEINKAYDSIKSGDFSQYANSNAENSNSDDFSDDKFTNESNSLIKDFVNDMKFSVTFTKYDRQKNKWCAICSIGLFAGCMYLLTEYVLKYCNYERFYYFFTDAFNKEDFFAPNMKRVAEYLPKINIELYINILAKMFLACAISITAVFLLTAIYNVFYICCFDKIKKISKSITYNKDDLDEDECLNFLSGMHKTGKIIKAVKTVNIMYAVVTYLTLLSVAATIAMYAVFQSALFFPIKFKTYKFLMIAIAIVMFVVVAIFISEKCDRIKGNKCFENANCIENLDTFFKGLGIALVPMLIILSLVILGIYIVVSLLGGGKKND